ncbi:hypothetical protein [Vulcanisaeta distributa]|uniref:hypothetical protein n=1 Tax=Vulcanisaeta distributa TaxID=164451 RepID=UPI0006CFF8E1|nr:hypothetical protein [Vulcanisaeta distributa]
MFIDLLKSMGFRKSNNDNSWLKDYGNNVTLKVMPTDLNEVEIELDMPIPTGLNPDLSSDPKDFVYLIMSMPIDKDLLQSLHNALNDLMSLRLIMIMSN